MLEIASYLAGALTVFLGVAVWFMIRVNRLLDQMGKYFESKTERGYVEKWERPEHRALEEERHEGYQESDEDR